jgi:TetR/AcrR family transcriptional repressor of bet genes
MPIVVDHEERRQRVIDIASCLLARYGLAAVTVRDVARAAGVSTAIVSHYFKDKDELLLLTFRRNVELAAAGADDAFAATGNLKAFIEPAMPLDAARVDRWRIWLAYLAQLASHPEIAAIQRESAADRIARLEAILRDFDARGRLRPGLEPRRTAERLLAVIMGLAIEVLFDLDAWPAARQHELVDAELASILLPT